MLNKTTLGFGLSAAIVSIFNGLLVIVKETNAGLLAWMKALTGHHWITHGVFDIALFLILGFLLSRTKLAEKWDGHKMANVLIACAVVGALLIVGFNLKEI